ncbi:MAG: hypothetical protein QRY16_03100 [Enterobacterales bacterium endosymbiont of Blomia tropicalis]|uniref:hypothetical protein n=1 Tax=Mixta mediterraneensis TaxID=2758443 RepID=UPI0025A9302F|nr:hypothetical protein [Mixta mediterraneensis]MDL4912801.1 hypothetical protein [Mixta mediterraneensis]
MINIKENIDHIRVYYYSNEHLFKSELIKLGSYEFYDKYLYNLTPRIYLDFLQFLIDDISERKPIIPDETTSLISYMLGKEILTKQEDNSFAISENFFTENYQDLTKKFITLNNIHTAKREKNIIESKFYNRKVLSKTKKRL